MPARRVRHILECSAKRGEVPPETLQKTFRTKTGERSAVAYPVAWLGSLIPGVGDLIDVENPQAETLQRSAAERSANEAKQSGGVFQQSAPERSEAEDWKVRALLAEAERDTWKEQSGKWEAQAEKALQLVDQAQQLQLVAERKVAELEGKVLPAVEQKDASSRADSHLAQESGIGGGIVPPGTVEEPRRGFWSFLRRWW